ncbi:hypothetical protein HWV62_42404 [Athelia sp. TMB]|nr:hypothetical protein HWV62_42404 [Athelia sp. TMB]
MNALSRREEDTLLKTTKARALKECDAFVKGAATPLSCQFYVAFAECATGRTLSVAWACKANYKAVQDCMVQ